MKKILIILLSLFILCGCSNKDNIKEDDSTSDEIIDDNAQETIEISFDIWDIDPVYEFDDIDVDLTSIDCAANYFASPFNFSSGALYGYVEEGGVEIVNGDYFGFMNSKGEIIQQPTNIAIGKLTSNSIQIQTDKENSGYLEKDYSISGIQISNFLGLGGTGYPYYVWDNDSISICDWSGSNCTVTGITAKQLFNQMKNGFHESNDVGENNFFTFTYSNGNSNKIIIVKEDGYIPLDLSSDYYVYDISEDIIEVSKINASASNKAYEITYVPVTTAYVSYPQYRDNTFYDVMYLDSDGNQIGETYETGYPFYEGYAAVKKDGKWGYIDKQGNVVVDFIFDKATSISDGKAWVIYNGKTGRLNIMDMINNNVPFTDEYLNVDAWKSDGKKRLEVTADALKKRQSASTSSDRVGRVAKGSILVYTDTTTADGYTWYKLEDGSYIADQNGEWISELNS